MDKNTEQIYREMPLRDIVRMTQGQWHLRITAVIVWCWVRVKRARR